MFLSIAWPVRDGVLSSTSCQFWPIFCRKIPDSLLPLAMVRRGFSVENFPPNIQYPHIPHREKEREVLRKRERKKLNIKSVPYWWMSLIRSNRYFKKYFALQNSCWSHRFNPRQIRHNGTLLNLHFHPPLTWAACWLSACKYFSLKF